MSPHETGSATRGPKSAAVKGCCDPAFAPVRDAFRGHFGAGGSLGFCDPERGVAFGYVMNQMARAGRTPAPAPWSMPSTHACDPDA
jgi:hypothetical protein